MAVFLLDCRWRSRRDRPRGGEAPTALLLSWELVRGCTCTCWSGLPSRNLLKVAVREGREKQGAVVVAAAAAVVA